jgi:hypothetical protein
VRAALRLSLTLAVAAVLAAPAANAAAATSTTVLPTATTAAPSVTTTPQSAPGSAFGPLQPLGTGAATSPTQTVTTVKRPGGPALGGSTLLLLSLVALVLIFGVVGLIWYEGRRTGANRKRRQRMRSGRTPATAAAGARRGPPPPPRKRRAQAKRKKR